MTEGEARSLALAAFLSELSTAAHASGIIFDDPVSSLDHRWRERVARRLVEEAKTRQVVVFTHELVFLYELVHRAEELGVDCAARSLRRERTAAGFVEDDLPWSGKSTKDRLAWLRDEQQALAKVHRHEGKAEYDARATVAYARLRKTWERAVEEVLLNAAVLRFRDSVQTQRLKVVTAQDIETVTNGMTKTSKWEGGHDQALAMNEPVPGPDDLKTDIDTLSSWVDGLRKRA